MDAWYDDPLFDDTIEVLPDGKRVCAEDWRRLQRMKEDAAARGKTGEVISVAGTTFRSAAISSLDTHTPGKVSLVPEPENPVDNGALRVEIDARFVGYMPKVKRVSPDATARLLKHGTGGQAHVWLFVESA